MKTYIEQLKHQYTDPSKAYKYYALSKNLLHCMAVSENAPQEIKDIVNVQNILNAYCENLIENETPKPLYEYFFTENHFEILHFLEIQYEFRDSILDGKFQNKLEKIVSMLHGQVWKI